MKLAHAILGVFLGSLSFLSVSQNAQASYGDWNQYRYEHANDRDRDYDREYRHDHDRNRDYDRDRGYRHEEGRNRDYHSFW